MKRLKMGRVVVVFLLLTVMAALGQPSAVAAPPPDAKADKTTAYKISPAETDKLFREVDDIFAFVVKDTGLPQKQPVKKRVVSREQVADYVEEQLNKDEDAKRLDEIYRNGEY